MVFLGFMVITIANPLQIDTLHEVGHWVTLEMLVMLKTDRLMGKSIGKGYDPRKTIGKTMGKWCLNCGFMRFYGSYLLVN